LAAIESLDRKQPGEILDVAGKPVGERAVSGCCAASTGRVPAKAR
jgi:hypothetical protein